MIEIVRTYDLVPDIDLQAYAKLIERALAALRNAPGFVELRAHRNLLGSAQVRTTAVWRSLADWAQIRQSAEQQPIEAEFGRFVTNLKAEIWGPSPFLREAIRSGASQ